MTKRSGLPQPPGAATLPLEGIRIIDFSIVWAGPQGALHLGDLGAELIRVESLQHPDINTRGPIYLPPAALAGPRGAAFPHRDPGKRPWERSALHVWTGRHKYSVTIDLEQDSGKEIFARLLRISDIVFDNNAAGTLEKMGITYDFCRQINPQIIMIQFPGYGMTGPYKYFKGYGANVEAVSGHTSLRGYPNGDVRTTYSVYYADPSGGNTAAFAVLAALHHRYQTGEGQHIDMSQEENLMAAIGPALLDYAMNGRGMTPSGNRHSSAIEGCYPCQGEDEWVTISIASDAEWQTFCQIMGEPSLAEEERFADVVSRRRNQDEVDGIIMGWTALRDKYEVTNTLQGAGIAAGAVIPEREMLTNPHLRERGFFEVVDHPTVGSYPYAGPAFDMSKTPLRIRLRAPFLGEDNEYVYKELLSYSDEEYQRFIDEGHVGDTYVAASKMWEEQS